MKQVIYKNFCLALWLNSNTMCIAIHRAAAESSSEMVDAQTYKTLFLDTCSPDYNEALFHRFTFAKYSFHVFFFFFWVVVARLARENTVIIMLHVLILFKSQLTYGVSRQQFT